jgi:stage III sporulation protein AF
VIAALTSWIKEIIYIILFATFLEFLLPNGQMRKFIRVIIGLFIMLAILSPVMDIMSRGQQLDRNFSQRVMSRQDSKTNESATKIAASQEELARDLYRQQLAKQIRAIVVTLAGVGDAQVVVELDQPVNNTRPGDIHKVLITLQQRQLSSVAPVALSGAEPVDNGPDDQVKAKVTRTVAELYQLSPQRIFVK